MNLFSSSTSSAAVQLHVELVEPLVFLRNAGRQASRQAGDFDGRGGACQLRGIATLIVQKPTTADRVRCTFVGTSVSMHWNDKVPAEDRRQVYAQTEEVRIGAASRGDSLLLPGTYGVPISIAVPATLPPTVDTEFARLGYTLTACVMDASGTQLARLSDPIAVRLIYDAAAPPSNGAGTTDEEQDSSAFVRNGAPGRTVEGDWNDALHYRWTSAADHATVGASMPIQLVLAPLRREDGEAHAVIKGIRIALAEETSVRPALTEQSTESSKQTPIRRLWTLLDLTYPSDALGKPIVPPAHDDDDDGSRVQRSMTEAMEHVRSNEVRPADDVGKAEERTDLHDVDSSLAAGDCCRTGPWSMAWDVQLPVCAKTRCNSTIRHPDSPVTVTHSLHLTLTVQPNVDGPTCCIDLSKPFIVRSIYLTEPYSQLPCYWCACCLPHPYEARSTPTTGGVATYHSEHNYDTTPADEINTTAAASSTGWSALSFVQRRRKHEFKKRHRDEIAQEWLMLST